MLGVNNNDRIIVKTAGAAVKCGQSLGFQYFYPTNFYSPIWDAMCYPWLGQR